MKVGEIQIVGLKRYEGKRGIGTVISYITPYSDYDTENCDCFGFDAGQEFTYLDTSLLNVGDIVSFNYAKGFGGKAVMSGYNMVKPANKETASKQLSRCYMYDFLKFMVAGCIIFFIYAFIEVMWKKLRHYQILKENNNNPFQIGVYGG